MYIGLDLKRRVSNAMCYIVFVSYVFRMYFVHISLITISIAFYYFALVRVGLSQTLVKILADD